MRKMRVRAGSVNSAKISRAGEFLAAWGQALFDFSVKIIFWRHKKFFVRFFLSVLGAISSLKHVRQGERETM
jgi:hypothetical protein